MNPNRISTYILTLLTAAILVLTGCKRDQSQTGHIVSEAKVAVILPMNDGLDEHWHRTLDLAARNVRLATQNAGVGINIRLEYYDELSTNLSMLADSLSKAGDVTAVIGGLYSNSANTLASRFVIRDLPLFTMATTEQLVRAYSSWGNLWAMTETDITQCEVLLSKATMYGAKSVALIAKDGDAYCQTFIDWFAFQTQELGLHNSGTFLYTDASRNAIEDAFASGADCVICIPAEIDDIPLMLAAQKVVEQRTGKPTRALFSDTAFGADVIQRVGVECEGLEGITFGAHPESGWEIAYQVLFDDNSTLGEAQVYDACMMIGLAVMMQQLHKELSFKLAMQRLVSGRDMALNGWMLENMSLIAQAIANGSTPNISGASGALDFDSKVFTNVLSTVYYDYIIYNQQYVIIDYNSTDGSKRSDATLAGWNWKAQQMQELGEGGDITLPALDQRWALLVATSSGWSNYRHQADVLNMYQILRHHGYDDDHIVLIMEDDIAYAQENQTPGVIHSRVSGENVYQNVVVDYHPSDLHPADLTSILSGKRSSRLPYVLTPDLDDNVLIFWSGHGTPIGMNWMSRELFTYDDAEYLFTYLENAGCYRRLIWLAETCYSGRVASAVEGHSGMLAIAAANANETSKADVYDLSTNVWLSNRFTATLHDCLTTDPSISMRDLYYRLFQNTVGSHVCVYGTDDYGNLYTSTMAEYVGS